MWSLKKKHATEEASWISVYRGQSLFPDLLFDTSFTKILPWGKEEFFLEYNWIRFHWGFCLGKVLGNTIFGISQKVSFFLTFLDVYNYLYIGQLCPDEYEFAARHERFVRKNYSSFYQPTQMTTTGDTFREGVKTIQYLDSGLGNKIR